jgi:hypothetical protein
MLSRREIKIAAPDGERTAFSASPQQPCVAEATIDFAFSK